MQRILSHQLAGHVGETVYVAGWIHRRRLLKSVAFLILRDAARARSDRRRRPGYPGAARVVAGGDDGRRRRNRDGEPRRAGRGRDHVAGDHTVDRPGRIAAVRPLPAVGGGQPADDPRPRTGRAPASAARGRPPDRCRGARRLPARAGRAVVRRNRHPEDRRYGDRKRRQRLSPRLLRPPGLSGAVAAALQADHGRRVRAGVRGRQGVPGRAQRHRSAPRRIHVPRPGDGVRH